MLTCPLTRAQHHRAKAMHSGAHSLGLSLLSVVEAAVGVAVVEREHYGVWFTGHERARVDCRSS